MTASEAGVGWPATTTPRAANRGVGWPSVSRETSPQLDPVGASAESQQAEDPDAVLAPAAGDDPVAPVSPGVRDAGNRQAAPGRPARTRIVTVANQKGGVGKTTSTVNLAAAMSQAGLVVLVIDLDPQGNASTALGIDHHSDVASIYDVLIDGQPLDQVVSEVVDLPGLLCAPATIDLAGAEIELVPLVAREARLRKALETYVATRTARGDERLDVVLIDCPPSLGLLTVNALVAAEEVLIPIQCEYYALEGLGQLLKNVEMVREHLNPALHVSTILLTMYDARTRLAAQVADDVRVHFPDQVLATAVPRSVRVSEAPSYGQTVLTYDPASSGALAYTQAAREILLRDPAATPAGPTVLSRSGGPAA